MLILHYFIFFLFPVFLTATAHFALLFCAGSFRKVAWVGIVKLLSPLLSLTCLVRLKFVNYFNLF